MVLPASERGHHQRVQLSTEQGDHGQGLAVPCLSSSGPWLGYCLESRKICNNITAYEQFCQDDCIIDHNVLLTRYLVSSRSVNTI